MGLFEDELRRTQQIKAQNNAMMGGADLGQTLSNIANNSKAQDNKNIFETFIGGIGEKINDIGSTLNNIGKTVVGGLTENSKKRETEDIMANSKAKYDEIARKYGYANYSDASADEKASKDFWNEIGQVANDTTKKLEDKSEREQNSYGNVRDIDTNMAKGQALSTIGTVFDLAPGWGMVGNIASGTIEGIGDAYKNAAGGGEVSLQDALSRAAAGGLAAAVGGGVAKKLGAGKTILGQAGKSAVSGGIGGATAGGIMAAANGGDILQGAVEGGKSGAAGGALMGGSAALVGKVGQGVSNKIKGVKNQPITVEKVPEVGDAQAEKSNMVGRALKKTGNQLESAQTDITRAERRKYGIADAGQTVENVRKRTGLSSLQDQADFAKNITGAGDDSVMDTIQKYNMAKGKDGQPITLTTSDYEVAINDAVGKNWKKSVMGKDYYDFRDDVISDIKNLDPIKAANNLKESAAIQRAIADGKGPTADQAAVKAKIYTDMANKIDDLSYSAIPQENVNRMFDDTIDEFKTRAQEAKAQGNKKYAKAYENLAKDLENTDRTIANYRTFKKDFVKSSQLADISNGAQSGSLQAGIGKGTTVKNKVLNTVFGEPSNRALAYAGGKLNDLGDAINKGRLPRINTLDSVDSGVAGYLTGKNTIDSPLKGRVATAALNGIADNVTALDAINPNIRTKIADLSTALQQNIGSGENINSLINIGNRMQARGIAQNQVNYAERAKFEQDAADAINNAINEYGTDVLNYTTAPENLNDTQRAAISSAIGNMPQMAQGYTQGTTQYSTTQAPDNSQLDRISKAAELALNAGDLEAYATLLDLYKQALSLYGGGNTSSTAQQTKLSDSQVKAYNALQQLNTLAAMSPDFGTALANSPLGGLVSLTGGNDYANQAQSLALTLGYLQSGANVSAKEAENIGKSYIPTAFDSEQTRQNKLARARELINGYLINTPYYQQ